VYAEVLTVCADDPIAQVSPASGCVLIDTASAELSGTAVGKGFVELSEKVKLSVPFLRIRVLPGNKPVTLTLIGTGPVGAGESLLPPPQAPRDNAAHTVSEQATAFRKLD
jgi:hypothetical protein